ncbi:MAG TPA: hypothetical protein PKZ90_15985 [Chitinophagaceae bacterium]|nr:hypothetical protein [Chitinophagaceae bacterium]
MKNYMLPVLLLCTCNLFSQNKIGIATYTVPEGWKTTQEASVVMLENKQGKGTLCRITIFETEKTAVNTAAIYLQYRTSKNGTKARFNPGQKQVIRTESNGFISFYSGGTSTVNESNVKSHFYSFTNNKETFFVELLTDSNVCTEEFNRFLSSLLIDPASEERSGNIGTNAARRKKAAPSAVPAAPAPMM